MCTIIIVHTMIRLVHFLFVFRSCLVLQRTINEIGHAYRLAGRTFT